MAVSNCQTKPSQVRRFGSTCLIHVSESLNRPKIWEKRPKLPSPLHLRHPGSIFVSVNSSGLSWSILIATGFNCFKNPRGPTNLNIATGASLFLGYIRVLVLATPPMSNKRQQLDLNDLLGTTVGSLEKIGFRLPHLDYVTISLTIFRKCLHLHSKKEKHTPNLGTTSPFRIPFISERSLPSITPWTPTLHTLRGTWNWQDSNSASQDAANSVVLEFWLPAKQRKNRFSSSIPSPLN